MTITEQNTIVRPAASKVPTKVVINAPIVDRLDRYIAARNAVIAPAELTRTAVVNDAIAAYLERREAEGA